MQTNKRVGKLKKKDQDPAISKLHFDVKLR